MKQEGSYDADEGHLGAELGTRCYTPLVPSLLAIGLEAQLQSPWSRFGRVSGFWDSRECSNLGFDAGVEPYPGECPDAQYDIQRQSKRKHATLVM